MEEREAEKKAAASLTETPTTTPPLSSETEKEKGTHIHRESSKVVPGKGKTQSGD